MTFDFWAVVLAVNVILTGLLWQRVIQRPGRPKKKFIRLLRNGKPIIPAHRAPQTTEGDSQSDRVFFEDFAWFGEVVNSWLSDEHVGASSWRLQELPETQLKLNHWQVGPQYGRSYQIWFNQVRLGRLEVSAGYPYSTETQNMYAFIELENVRLLPFGTVEHFLGAISDHVNDENENARLKSQRLITDVMLQVLWRIQEIDTQHPNYTTTIGVTSS